MEVSAPRKSGSKDHGFKDLSASHKVRWDKKMSNNCAAALLVYTMAQIFFVLGFIQTKGMSVAPYFGLILLVAFIIPFCRKYEKRWEKLQISDLSDQSLAARFRADQVTLWILATGLPFLFVGVIKIIGAMI